MLFSSLVFIYLFLPLALLFYYTSPRVIKNYILLIASLIFFAWGGVSFTGVLLASIIINYFFGLQIQKRIVQPSAYRWLVAGVTFNLLLLGVFKYADFFTDNINILTDLFDTAPLLKPGILLPVGISFYTFHALSYLIDIYHRKTEAQKNIFNLALYITMFSQLIAGPIIRYSDVWQQLTQRSHTFAKFSSGVERFIIGLGKKVLLANTLALAADKVFATNPENLTAASAWLGIVCYSLQIYFDFSGYSDMAIGLGRMFGFEFMENFNFPYMAKSVKEFWRRWHISLSSFFRDYVYIPLGGNRVSSARAYFNMIIVFFLTGFWHGASWNFVVWGLFHGFFMLLERAGFEKILARVWAPVSQLYTILVVVFAWVLFRADDLGYALHYWRAMFTFSLNAVQMSQFVDLTNPELLITLIIAISAALGVFLSLGKRIEKCLLTNSNWPRFFAFAYHTGSALFYGLIVFVASLYLVSGSYNPFIYYRF